jgi:hypothetical protein
MSLFPVPLLTPDLADAVIEAWIDDVGLTVDQWRLRRWGVRESIPCPFSFGREGDGVIYFAESDSGPIKVGWSSCPMRRVAALGNRSRIFRPIVIVDGQSTKNEMALHSLLSRFSSGRRAPRFRPVEWYLRESPVSSLAYRLANASVSAFAERYQEPFYRERRRRAVRAA